MKTSSKENSEDNILEELYKIYESKMYGIAYSILNNVEQAEDAVHDAFIKINSHLNHIKKANSLETKRFVTYIIKNIAIDKYRRNRKEVELFTKGVDEPGITKSPYEIDSVTRFEDRELIFQLLSQLPSKHREIIRYRCYYELSYREIGELLGISEKVAAKRCERARKLLKEIIEKNMEGDRLYG